MLVSTWFPMLTQKLSMVERQNVEAAAAQPNVHPRYLLNCDDMGEGIDNYLGKVSVSRIGAVTMKSSPKLCHNQCSGSNTMYALDLGSADFWLRF